MTRPFIRLAKLFKPLTPAPLWRFARNKWGSDETTSEAQPFDVRLPDISRPSTAEQRNLKPFFVHVHIPKTAGTSFNRTLTESFGDTFEPFGGRWLVFLPRFTNDQVLDFMRLHTNINCVASHNFTAILPYRNPLRRIVAIAFLRDPVDRFFSLYFHLRFRGGDFIETKLELDDYISGHEKQARERGGRLPGLLSELTIEESEESFTYIESLVRNGDLHLLQTDAMDDGCQRLNKLFPNHFKAAQGHRENVSKRDQDVTDEQRERVKKIVSPYDWKLLELAAAAK
jgi:hypothetical protein